MRILDQRHILYEEYEIQWEESHLGTDAVAEKLGIEEALIFKTLVAVGNKTGPVVAVIPGNTALDLKKLAKASGNKKVEMLHLKDLETATGYIRGGCSPIGMKKLYPTFLGKEAENMESVIISAGKRGHQVALAPDAILQIVKGSYADITSLED